MARKVERHSSGFFVATDEAERLPAAFANEGVAWAAFNVPREELPMVQLFANMRVGGVIGPVQMSDLLPYLK